MWQWNSNHLPSHPQSHYGPKLIGNWVMEKEAATVRPHDLGSLLGYLKEHSIDLQIQADELLQFE
jgi:hypothetical protein